LLIIGATGVIRYAGIGLSVRGAWISILLGSPETL